MTVWDGEKENLLGGSTGFFFLCQSGSVVRCKILCQSCPLSRRFAAPPFVVLRGERSNADRRRPPQRASPPHRDAQLCALLSVTRFRRTSGPSEKQKPGHLVRACCRSESQAEQLLLQGRVSLDGQECAVERPKAASDSSAATGKRPATTTLEALLESFPRVGNLSSCRPRREARRTVERGEEQRREAGR